MDNIWTIPGSVANNNKFDPVPMFDLALEVISGLHQHEEGVLSGALGNRQRSIEAKDIHPEIDQLCGYHLRRSAGSCMASVKKEEGRDGRDLQLRRILVGVGDCRARYETACCQA